MIQYERSVTFRMTKVQRERWEKLFGKDQRHNWSQLIRAALTMMYENMIANGKPARRSQQQPTPRATTRPSPATDEPTTQEPEFACHLFPETDAKASFSADKSSASSG